MVTIEEFIKEWQNKELHNMTDSSNYLSYIKGIAEKYRNEKGRNHEIGFNVFKLVSRLYYRENFHSDIIKEILDPYGSHNEGTLFLNTFIESINDKITEVGKKILQANYLDAIVEREKNGRIDITIRSERSRHCIIIENKLHNAGDQLYQLPRYYKNMTGKGYIVDRIVYIPLDRKAPYEGDWTKEDKEAIEPLLSIMVACDDKNLDLVYSWLMKCQKRAKYVNSNSVLQQYIELLENLSDSIMMNKIMEDFYLTMIDEDKRKIAASISEMYGKLQLHRAERLKSHFIEAGYYPFKDLWIWNNYDCILESFPYQKSNITLDLFCDPDGYSLKLWSRGDYKDLTELFPDWKLLKEDFIKEDNNLWWKRGYKFNDENEVIKKAEEVRDYLRQFAEKQG